MEHSQGEILKDEGGGDISMEEIEFMNVSVKIWVQVRNYFERYGKIHTWQENENNGRVEDGVIYGLEMEVCRSMWSRMEIWGWGYV